MPQISVAPTFEGRSSVFFSFFLSFFERIHAQSTVHRKSFSSVLWIQDDETRGKLQKSTLLFFYYGAR
uniref:Uncharacterized protein n=1 Tax=Anguilla anguilla TaxID=7936 RepID=A0A0E9SND5_ANGAN